MIIASFLCFLLLFVAIGLSSVRYSKQTNQDYLLAGQNVKPWLCGLSAAATCNSGYMFTGMIGFTYNDGLQTIWAIAGWVLGDLFISFFVHKKLRAASGQGGVHTFVGTLSSWEGVSYKNLRILSALVAIIFLGTYAAAQLNAGSKALQVLFGWDHYIGAIIGSVIALIYCVAGGIRASIWTDAAQSIVMIVAMAFLFVVGVQGLGGISSVYEKLQVVDPTYMSWFPEERTFGGLSPLLFMSGWFFAGIGVIGQPHIMVRFMAVDKAKNIGKVRAWYYVFYGVFCLITLGAGLLAKLFIPETANFDAELALPLLSIELLPAILVGLVLAGIFAATMSTADSLILSCAASLTRDLGINKERNYIISKLGTVIVTALALAIALWGSSGVLDLVVVSWGVMGAGFGPILFVYSLGRRPNEPLAIAMLCSGVSMIFLWRYLGYSSELLEIFPAIMTALLVYFIGDKFGLGSRRIEG